MADAVTAIEREAHDPDDLYAAARACEDKLGDPARALALYDRIHREFPDAKAARAADERGAHLREQTAGGHEREAREFAALVRDAAASTTTSARDGRPANDAELDAIIRRGDALASASWPGANEAALWLAEWLRHQRRFGDADTRYTKLGDYPKAKTGRVGNAIEARDYDRAASLLADVSRATAEDRAVYDDLVRELQLGRLRDRLYVVAWILLFASIAALVASLAEACARGGWKRPRLRPPVEIWFLAPIAAVFVGVAFTANSLIAPAVIRIATVGVALAWLSGTTLDHLRARGRRVRLRAVLHVLICAAGTLAIAYIALTRTDLIDMLIETLKYGPES
ncbi:MAG: hypothetical protein QM831_15530 [Kofleriaceae bacterium]